jgi:hypothetical protein
MSCFPWIDSPTYTAWLRAAHQLRGACGRKTDLGCETCPNLHYVQHPCHRLVECTREIGILGTVGATAVQVRRMVLTEALLLAAILLARQAAKLKIMEAPRYE